MTDGAPARKRILIVDDDPSIRHMLSRVLTEEGYDAPTAAGGCEGLKTAAAEPIDLVLLDLKMPHMDGPETLKRLQALRPGLPVIMMTAFSGGTVEGGLDGVGALLQKPLDFPMLLDAIKLLLAKPATCK